MSSEDDSELNSPRRDGNLRLFWGQIMIYRKSTFISTNGCRRKAETVEVRFEFRFQQANNNLQGKNGHGYGNQRQRMQSNLKKKEKMKCKKLLKNSSEMKLEPKKKSNLSMIQPYCFVIYTPHNCNVYRKDQVLKSFLNLMNPDIIMNIMR